MLRSPSKTAAPLAFTAPLPLQPSDRYFAPIRSNGGAPPLSPSSSAGFLQPRSPASLHRESSTSSAGFLLPRSPVPRDASLQSSTALPPRAQSPTWSTELKARSRSPSPPRPVTPGSFWKPASDRIDTSPDHNRPLSPLVWMPSGSELFPVAWNDSPALAEPLKPRPSTIGFDAVHPAPRRLGVVSPLQPLGVKLVDGAAERWILSRTHRRPPPTLRSSQCSRVGFWGGGGGAAAPPFVPTVPTKRHPKASAFRSFS